MRLPASADGLVDLNALLERLGQLGINRLMVEGGANIITSFFSERLVDHFVLTIAPMVVGGLRAVNRSEKPDPKSFPPWKRRMKKLSIRWRLTVWNTVAVATLLVACVGFVYGMLKRTLYDWSLTRERAGAADPLAAGIGPEDFSLRETDLDQALDLFAVCQRA